MEHKFVPFQKVLVRCYADHVWRCNIYSHRSINSEQPHECVWGAWKYCIPYEGNEHLLVTTDSPTPKHEYKWGDIVECQHSNGEKWIKAIYIDYNETYNVHEVIWQGCKCIGHASHIRPLAEDK